MILALLVFIKRVHDNYVSHITPSLHTVVKGARANGVPCPIRNSFTSSCLLCGSDSNLVKAMESLAVNSLNENIFRYLVMVMHKPALWTIWVVIP